MFTCFTIAAVRLVWQIFCAYLYDGERFGFVSSYFILILILILILFRLPIEMRND